MPARVRTHRLERRNEELNKLYHRHMALPGILQQLSFRCHSFALPGWGAAETQAEFRTGEPPSVRASFARSIGIFALPHLPSSVAAEEVLSLLWQMLAVLAMGGILLVLLFAIIEPGPLVKKRPFSRQRRPPPTAEQQDSSDMHGIDKASCFDDHRADREGSAQGTTVTPTRPHKQ